MRKPVNTGGAKGLVPRLRFPEFRGAAAWSTNTIEQLCDSLDGDRKPVTKTDRRPGEYPYYGASGIVDYVDSYIFDEELVLVGEDGAKWGAYEPTAFVAKGKYWVNNHAHVLRPTGIVASLLADYLTKTDLSLYVTGAAPPKLTGGKLARIPIPVAAKAEQQKIADCLSSLDDLITAHTDKLAALKRHKQGLLEQLFPREGETVPRLRFPEFRNAGEWGTKKLADVATIVRGGSPRPIADYMTEDSGGLAWLKIGDVGEGAKYITKTSERIKRTGLSKTREIHSGDLILSNSMSFGRPYLSRMTACIHDGWLAITNLSHTVSSEFAYYLLSSGNCQAYFADAAAGSGVHNLNIDIVAALSFSVPSKQEQIEIATCLSTLDTLITAQTDRLAALKQHKQGLLQQLFPAMDEGAT